MREIPVLVIGVGVLGRGRAQMVHEAPEFTLAAVCDIDEATLNGVGEACGVPPAQRFLDPGDACQRSGAELALIVTLPRDHADHVACAFEGGLHVLCSKPLCESPADARKIRDLCRTHPHLRFMVDQNSRWTEQAEAVRRALRSGLLGRVGYITWVFEQAWRFGGWRDEMAEVLLADMSVHHFDLLRYVTGRDATEVYARSFNPPWSWFRGNACASAIFQLEEEVWANYFGSWAARGRAAWGSEVRIAGELGAIHWPTDGPPIAVMGTPEQDREGVSEEALAPVPLEHTRFLFGLYELGAAIREDREPAQCTIDDNLHTMAMVIGARESARSNRPVRLDTLGLY